jgi:hypothetical protein
MTEPNSPTGQAHHDVDAWRRILAAPTVLDVLAGHVDDWAPVPAESAGWLTRTALPEISFGSDILGAGVEFEIVSPWRDPQALNLLRSIQRALVRYVDASLLPSARAD